MAVELEDLITIHTPEGIELKLALAGLGSRFIAGTADLILQVLLTLILALFTGGFGGSNGFQEAIFYIGVFVISSSWRRGALRASGGPTCAWCATTAPPSTCLRVRSVT
jgi:hypothetical protein